MTDELKPCMCGGTAKYDIITRYDTGAYGSGSRYFEYRVICEKCGIRTKTYDESEKLIPITVWNNRVEPDTLPSWAIEAIENEIFELWEEYAKTGIIRLDACARKLEWVLALRKPEEK